MHRRAAEGIEEIIYEPLEDAVNRGESFDEAKKSVADDPEVAKRNQENPDNPFALTKEDYDEMKEKSALTNKMQMLVSLADEFDQIGLSKQASMLDNIIKSPSLESLERLAGLSDEFDKRGYHKQADKLDDIIKSMADYLLQK